MRFKINNNNNYQKKNNSKWNNWIFNYYNPNNKMINIKL